jgi:hypothetical protein
VVTVPNVASALRVLTMLHVATAHSAATDLNRLAALSAATVLSVVTALSAVATLNVPVAEETNRAAARAPSVARKQRRRPHARRGLRTTGTRQPSSPLRWPSRCRRASRR